MVQNILGERDNKPTHAASLEHSKLIILTCTRCEWFNQLCFIDFHSTLGFVVSIRVWTKTKKHWKISVISYMQNNLTLYLPAQMWPLHTSVFLTRRWCWPANAKLSWCECL